MQPQGYKVTIKAMVVDRMRVPEIPWIVILCSPGTTPGPTFNLISKKRDNSFAMALGGGLDIRASKRVSFRALMDYNPVFVRDSPSGTRDFVRLSLGVLIH